MKRSSVLTVVLVAELVLSMLLTPAFAESKKSTATGDVALEWIGQVLNAPPTSLQYGYLSYINGLNNIFSGNPQNESTALFTFYNDSTTVRVIDNGPLRIVNREGTTTIYLDDTPDGDFTSPDSFRDGLPVMQSSFRHQVILDTTTNQFTTTFVNTITSADVFQFENQQVRLGRVGVVLRTIVFGRQNSTGAGPAQFVIGGYTPGGPLIKVNH